jgi:multidrug efflux pump subunit AcrA (membrane-fusion protein)
LATHGDSARENLSDAQEAEMAYERLDEALRQLKTDRERAEATEKQRKKAVAEARIRFARIRSAVIAPIFDEVAARLAAEGFFGETVDEQNDASGPISLNVNLSEDEGFIRQGTLQVRLDLDKCICEFGTATMAKTSSTNQIVFDDGHHGFDEMTEELVREKAEQFVLDLIAETRS